MCDCVAVDTHTHTRHTHDREALLYYYVLPDKSVRFGAIRDLVLDTREFGTLVGAVQADGSKKVRVQAHREVWQLRAYGRHGGPCARLVWSLHRTWTLLLWRLDWSVWCVCLCVVLSAGEDRPTLG